jgi:hypothetical protein
MVKWIETKWVLNEIQKFTLHPNFYFGIIFSLSAFAIVNLGYLGPTIGVFSFLM